MDNKVGTAGNDTFDAATTIGSWSTFDNINGGAGTDTLNVATTATAAPAGAKVLGVENINIATIGAGYTLDATTFTDLQNLTLTATTAGAVSVTAGSAVKATIATTGDSAVDVIGTGGSLHITGGSGAAAHVKVGQTAVANALTDVTVVNGKQVTITDRSGANAGTGSTLTTVSVSKATDDITITANGLTTLNLSGMIGASGQGDTTINAAAGTRTLTVNLNGMDAGAAGAAANEGFTLTDATATTLAITSATKASFDMAFTVGAATAVSVDAAVATQLDGITAAAARTLTLTGAGAITLDAQTLHADAVITSTGTGARTLTAELGVNQQYIGGDGADSIKIAANAAKSITTGAGNDVVTTTGVVGAGVTVDAGAGRDTVVMTVAQADAADNTAVFNSKFLNFEVLQISDALAANVLNMVGLGNMSTVVLAAGGAVGGKIDNLASGATVQLNDASTNLEAIIRDAAFNTADSINLVLNSSTGLTAGTIKAAAVETVNITANDAVAAGSAAVIHTLTLEAAGATTVTVTGNNGLNLTNTGNNVAITNFNAAGVVGNAAADTAANLAVTFVSANTTAGATVTITGGAGNDTLTGNAGRDIITGGAGNDTIGGAGGADVLTGGAGHDVFVINSKAESRAAAWDGAQSSFGLIDHITDFVGNGADAGDQIRLGTLAADFGAPAGTLASVTLAAVTVATAADFNALFAALGNQTESTANNAHIFDVTIQAGNLAGRVLVINDSTAAINANDTFINITGITGALHSNDFIFA